MRSKDLKVTPDEFFPTERVQDFLEWSLLRNWIKEWLKYVHWYWSVAHSPDVHLENFFKAPFYETSLKSKLEKKELSRFGLMWKCYDMVAEKGVTWNPLCLQEHLPGYLRMLLGRKSGNSFLVEPSGLTRLERNLKKKDLFIVDPNYQSQVSRLWKISKSCLFFFEYPVLLLARMDPLKYLFEKPVVSGRISR